MIIIREPKPPQQQQVQVVNKRQSQFSDDEHWIEKKQKQNGSHHSQTKKQWVKNGQGQMDPESASEIGIDELVPKDMRTLPKFLANKGGTSNVYIKGDNRT